MNHLRVVLLLLPEDYSLVWVGFRLPTGVFGLPVS
jgi:hypothetical protein